MARIRKRNTTKLEIIQLASELFLTEGYSNTSIKKIAEELEMSSGHIVFYFPTKDHLLATLVEMLCDYQWKMMKSVVDDGNTSMLAVCLEFAIMTSMCDENEIAKDFYVSTYCSPVTLDIIRKNDARRAKMVFEEYCQDWSDDQFREAEILVSGIEYSTLVTTSDPVPVELRIKGALNSILSIYGVPEDMRNQKIEKALRFDYKNHGRTVFREFINYVERTNDQAIEDVLTN